MNIDRQFSLLVVFWSAFLLGCKESSDESVDEILEIQDGEVSLQNYEAARAKALEAQKAAEAHFKVDIDLGIPHWVEGIPKVTWFELSGSREFCTIQGNVMVQLKLASGELIQERSNIIHIERDAKGISRIQFDAYERLSAEEAGERIEEEWPLFKAIGMKEKDFRLQRQKLNEWLRRDDDGQSSKEAIFHDGDEVKIMAIFSQYFDRKLGVGVRYVIHPYRIGETRWGKELTK